MEFNNETVQLENNNIIVKELYDDIKVNGIMQSYDQDSPFMFCKVVCADDYDEGEILVVKRYAKEEFVSGLFFVHNDDVRLSLSQEDYDNILNEGITY